MYYIKGIFIVYGGLFCKGVWIRVDIYDIVLIVFVLFGFLVVVDMEGLVFIRVFEFVFLKENLVKVVSIFEGVVL